MRKMKAKILNINLKITLSRTLYVKFFEIINASAVQDRALNCVKNKNSISNFNKYLDYERFGYGFDKKIQKTLGL